MVSDASSTSTLLHQASASSDSSGGDRNENGRSTNGGNIDSDIPAATGLNKGFVAVRNYKFG